MDNFLDKEFLGNTVWDYMWVIGVILFVLLLNRFISKYLAILLSKVFRRTWKTFDQKRFVDLIIHPLGIFLVITVSIVALYRLTFPDQYNITLYKYPLKTILLSIGIIIQIVAFIWLLLRVIDFIANVLEARALKTNDQADNQLVVFFRDFLKVIIGIIGLMLILHFAFSYDISSLLTGLSIVGAAVALALRESLENLIASFVIFFDKPFTTGDFVKVQNVSGNVEKIGLRSTRVRTTDKSYVTVPNKQMVDSILDNVTLRSQIRGEINLFVNQQTPHEKMKQLLAEIKKHLSSIKEVQSHNVFFSDFKGQAFVVFIEFFTPNIDVNVFNSLKDQLNLFILETMERLEVKVTPP
jgi:MscS family membrane protein